MKKSFILLIIIFLFASFLINSFNFINPFFLDSTSLFSFNNRIISSHLIKFEILLTISFSFTNSYLLIKLSFIILIDFLFLFTLLLFIISFFLELQSKFRSVSLLL